MAEKNEIDLSAFEIPAKYLHAFALLITVGQDETMKDYYKPSSDTKGMVTGVVDIILPLRDEKGEVKEKGSIHLITNDTTEYDVPRLTKAMLSYNKKTHVSHSIYFHPTHWDMIDKIRTGTYNYEEHGRKRRFGLMIIKGRGCITFEQK